MPDVDVLSSTKYRIYLSLNLYLQVSAQVWSLHPTNPFVKAAITVQTLKASKPTGEPPDSTDE